MVEPVGIRETPTACGRRFGSLVLQAPASLNALSLAMVDSLQAAFTRWAGDPGIVAVLLSGEGEKAFCAGGDLRDLYQSIRDCGSGDNAYAGQFFSREYRLDYLIHTYPKPILCWGNGIVMGGGMGLMAGCSHRVVTERTRMAMPEIAIGLFPDVGGSWFLNRMPGRIGLFLALTGAPLNAADALFTGLADFRLANASLAAVLEAMAGSAWHEEAADNARLLSRLLQDLAPPVNDGAGTPEAPEPWAPSNLRTHLDEIRALMGHDGLADIAGRLEQSATGNSWVGAAAAGFAKGSPTSAALAHALLQRARQRSLREVFQMEFDVALGCCAHHDFAEGIRALLIDKDRRPHWEPPRLQAVDEALIADHFKVRHAGAHPLADLR